MEEKVNKKYICDCGKIFESELVYKRHYANCIYWWRKHRTEEEYLNWKCNVSKIISETRQKKKNDALLLWISEKHVCEKCGKVMTEKFGRGRFCSRSCANFRIFSDASKLKKSKTVKDYVKDHPEWYGLHGKSPKGKQKKYFNSKAEIKLREDLKINLPSYDFTTGSFTKYKGYLLNPDIYSRKYKIIIEYDGIWHFVDILGQLKIKQERDLLLKDFILNSDFRLIRIDEDYKFTIDEIINYIVNDKRKIILLGNRYQYLMD